MSAEVTIAPHVVLGSWHTTPDPQRLDTLITMFGYGNEDQRDQEFSADIENLDRDRAAMYESKLEAGDDLDDAYESRHSQCKHPENLTPEEDKLNCMAFNVNKREYYSLSWEHIAESALEDSFLVELKAALEANNHEKLRTLLSGKRIHDRGSKNGNRAIKIEDLSLVE